MEDPFRNALLAVEQACLALRLDFYVLGALAKEVWFRSERIASRGTRDVDIAVFVSEEDQFQRLKELLIVDHAFTGSKENSFVLRAPGGIQVDILPFGQLEVNNGVAVSGGGLNRIKVNGFKEVYFRNIASARVLEDREYKIATLPGIVLLKLIAYDDRPEQRDKDPLDCIAIIENYFELQSNLIWDSHNDLFSDNANLKMIAARVIGREMQGSLYENLQLRERIEKILGHHIELGERSSFVMKMASQTNATIENCTEYLSEILNGIRDERTPAGI
ncbi:MAG: hypothetical protein JNL40_02105 [Cyclobacteriaceae bacterium]|nr:hypothetical protein [Cyclobacteriaceae bacterium]